MFYNAVTQDYRFLCLLWSVIFPRGSAGSIDTKFLSTIAFVWFDPDARELSQLLFSLLILLVEFPLMFALTILLRFVLLSIVLLSV